MEEATKNAAVFTHMGIETAHPMGKGHGPLNHLHSLTTLKIPQYVSFRLQTKYSTDLDNDEGEHFVTHTHLHGC